MDADRGGDRFEDGLESRVSRAIEDEHEDRLERIEREIHRLPDAQRVPLVLFHFEEMGYDEIARTLGVSVGKVKTDIHRGRQALRRLVTKDATR
jgi:RNA polymerase sigma-70 factor (ECF subfamily)